MIAPGFNHEPLPDIQYEKTENEEQINKIKEDIRKNKILYYYINKETAHICAFSEQEGKSYCISNILEFKEIFEDADILKCGYKQKTDYILLKQLDINVKNLMFDIEIAGYILNSNINKYTIEYLANEYLQFEIDEYISDTVGVDVNTSSKETQLNLFDNVGSDVTVSSEDTSYIKDCIYTYAIKELHNVLTKKMQEIDSLNLFENIEMPLAEVLADMQYVRNVC